MSDRIVIDQTKIRIVGELRSGGEFPRPLDWWQNFVPVWLTASSGSGHQIVLEPNGRRADGHVRELSPVLRRRAVRDALRWLDGLLYLGTSDAIVTGAVMS